MHESNRIEFKRELTGNLERAAVAFLNTREGGVIFLGIDDTGEVVGIEDIDSTQLKVKDRLKNNILPSCLGLFDVLTETRNSKNLIKIILASGPEKPYYLSKFGMTEKGCYTRIGSATEPMPQRMIEQLFAKRTRNAISKIRSNRQDLTFEQLRIYYDTKGLHINANFATSLELLDNNGDYNYVAYLLADSNNTSIKVAKYRGINRIDLIENNEYGYCSLIKATKAVLDKLNLENKTITEITAMERISIPLWNPIALREAVINAIVHNDFTNEIPPKFEIFDDRIEITSAGGLPEALCIEEFFQGISVPRNKELMRIFKDLDLVEHLGSGIPRILESYPKECFRFTENFLRMIFPASKYRKDPVVNQVHEQSQHELYELPDNTRKLIKALHGEMTYIEIQEAFRLAYQEKFKESYLESAISKGIVEVIHTGNYLEWHEKKYRISKKGTNLLPLIDFTYNGEKPENERMKPSYKGVKLRKERAKPTNEGVKPKKERTKPTNEGVKPKNERAKPTNEGVKPKNEGAKPENEGVKPISEGAKPENEGVKPEIKGASEKVKREISHMYSVICQNPGRRSNELSSKIGKSIATTERYLKILKEKGFIIFKGAPKTGGYYTKDV